ncbi:MAG: hypothetical protein J6S49_00705, partial [Erysipelotrichaceae bacterium]|nr:hypothetical protein [Erysipelotrichaceae bacterium]
MKKLLLIILCITLCACSKAPVWEDVAEKFKEVELAAVNPAETAEVFLASDYKKIINTLKSDIDSLEKIDEETMLRIYENAAVLENAVSQYQNEQAAQIKALSAKIKQLVRSYYEKGSDQAALKEELDQQFETVLNYSEDEWIAIEKRKLISWAEVESEYEALKEDAIANMTYRKDVTEIELEELNGIIVENYELIKDGINDANKEKADEMYKAAVILKVYTENLKNDNCQKVAAFADDAITYILKLYGAEVSDED